MPGTRGYCNEAGRRRSWCCNLLGAVRKTNWLLHLSAVLTAITVVMSAPGAVHSSSEAQFDLWLDELWLEARVMGITLATFDLAFASVEPDRALPDLVKQRGKREAGKGQSINRPAGPSIERSARAQTGKVQSINPPAGPLLKRALKLQAGNGQAEFSKTPARYLHPGYRGTLAQQGRALLIRHGATLARIEKTFGVHRSIVLAIWGRETAFGTYRPRHYAIKALATQAYLGRRKKMFRKELLFALKMLEDKVATIEDMRSSWAGALGLTQFMPSEFYSTAYDMDGDGRKDIWRSVPDALGSAARQLKVKGWISGPSWGYEVVLPPNALCSWEGPQHGRSLAEWAALGFKRTRARAFRSSVLGQWAYLMMPAGAWGPRFLVTENFRAIKRYNPSDLYALFVGHLADRINGGGGFAVGWAKIKQLRKADIAELQARLKAQGYKVGAVDGLIGSKTRSQTGLYQWANRLTVDCWPSAGLLQHMRSVASR